MTPTPIGFSFGLNPCQFELNQMNGLGSFDDDLESFFRDLQLGSKPDNYVFTYFENGVTMLIKTQ